MRNNINKKNITKSKNKKPITAEELGGLLFGVHCHHHENEKIMYYEDDLLKIFKLLGVKKPKWGLDLDLDKFIKKRK
jgi:hypothetical protein